MKVHGPQPVGIQRISCGTPMVSQRCWDISFELRRPPGSQKCCTCRPKVAISVVARASRMMIHPPQLVADSVPVLLAGEYRQTWRDHFTIQLFHEPAAPRGVGYASTPCGPYNLRSIHLEISRRFVHTVVGARG